MKFVKFILVLMMVFVCVNHANAAEPVNKEAVSAIIEVVKKHVSKETVESVYVEKIVGDYATGIVSVKDGEGGIACLKKAGKDWAVIFYGETLAESSLTALGVPTDIAKKLAE